MLSRTGQVAGKCAGHAANALLRLRFDKDPGLQARRQAKFYPFLHPRRSPTEGRELHAFQAQRDIEKSRSTTRSLMPSTCGILLFAHAPLRRDKIDSWKVVAVAPGIATQQCQAADRSVGADEKIG